MPSEKPSFASRFAVNAHPGLGGTLQVRQAPAEPPRRAVPSVSEEMQREVPSEKARTPLTARLLDALVSISLVALFFGLPIFFTGQTFQGIAFEKQIYFYAWILIGVIAWVSRGVVMGEMRIRRTPIDIPLLLFWLYYVASLTFSVDRWHSFWGFFGDPSRGVVSVTALVVAYYFVMSHFTPRRFYWVFGSFLTSGLIVSVWSLLVMEKVRFLPASLEQYAPLSLTGSVSALAVFLGALVPLLITALSLVWKASAIGRRLRIALTALAFAALAIALFLLLALYSFVPWVVILGGLSFFLVYVLAQIVRPAEQWTWVPMFVFVLVLAFLMIGRNGLARATLPVEVTPNIALSWQIAKNSLREHFFFGVGPANYGYAFSMYRPQEFNLNTLYTLRFYQGNGLFFESFSTLGVIGVILLLILWLSFLSIGLYLLTHEKQRNKYLSLGFWSASVMFLIAAFTVAMNGTLVLLGGLLAALALATLLWESGSEERYLQLSFKAAPKFALALAFIFMVVSAGVAFLFVFLGKVFVADVEAGKAARISATAPSLDAVDRFGRALAAYPLEGRYDTRLAQEYMALANGEAGKAQADRNLDTLKEYTQLAVAAADQGRQLMPNDVMAAETDALIWENAGLYATDALPKAEEAYTRARDLEPNNPLFSLKLGQIKKSMADGKPEGKDRDQLYADGKTLFQKAIDLKPDLAVAYYNLAVAESRLKDTAGAIENDRKALQYDAGNLSYQYDLAVLYQQRNGDGDQAQAESLLKGILGKNQNLIDVRLSLGLLYESQNKRDAAIAEYQKILDLIPDNAADNVKQTKDQVKKLIDNVKNGTGNLAKKNTQTVGTQGQPTGPVPAVTDPNQTPLAPSAP